MVALMPAFLKPCWSTSDSRFHGPGSLITIMFSFRFGCPAAASMLFALSGS